MLGVRLIGTLSLTRARERIELPKSRKLRALFAYLATTGKPATRTQLCELLWEDPVDPRGELRWCLSRLRAALGTDRDCLVANRDEIYLDTSCCIIDVAELIDAAEKGWDTISTERLRELSALTTGEFLEGLELAASASFSAWLSIQRCRCRNTQLSLLSHLARSSEPAERLRLIERWLHLEPYDVQAHEQLVEALVRLQRTSDARVHIERTVQRFDAEQLDSTALRRLMPSTTATAHLSTDAPSLRPEITHYGRRATLAIMPFLDSCAIESAPALLTADSLVHDIITRIAKLRSMQVLAPATMFSLRERGMNASRVAEMIGADYLVSGTIRSDGHASRLDVQLLATPTSCILWSDTFAFKRELTFELLEEIGNKIVASVVSQIETSETRRAVLRPPDSLDAWESYHRGLWHVYRFNKEDNGRALHYFQMAARLDPAFARAHAGISFAYFQEALQGWRARREAIQCAFDAAGESLNADDCDPTAHWALGRALWLQGEQDQALAELRRTVDLSPNFALGHYTLAFVQAQAGDASEAIRAVDHARRLSPFDPLLFGMLGARSIALLRLGEVEQAAQCAKQAAARPNAHVHIFAIAACCAALAGRLDDARRYVTAIRRTRPQYRAHDLLTAFRFDTNARDSFNRGAVIAGLK